MYSIRDSWISGDYNQLTLSVRWLFITSYPISGNGIIVKPRPNYQDISTQHKSKLLAQHVAQIVEYPNMFEEEFDNFQT